MGSDNEGARGDMEEEEVDPADGGPLSKKPKPAEDSSDEDRPDERAGFMSDFDLMRARKKMERGGRKRRKDVDIINDTDDMIAEFIKEMRIRADEDRELNKQRKAATKKLNYLSTIVPHMKKIDLKMAFLDQGVLTVMCDWLSPLPDKSLPHLKIREEMLRLLAEFPGDIDQQLLKSSGIGRAVMYLYKHPREIKENRERAGLLISRWSRPIFNLNTDYSTVSKEERESKDYERLKDVRRGSVDESTSKGKESKDEPNTAKPGEKGFVIRARVPQPSIKDYVVRPKWNVDTEFSAKNAEKKKKSRLDKHVRAFQERKKRTKAQRAVNISLEGRRMQL